MVRARLPGSNEGASVAMDLAGAVLVDGVFTDSFPVDDRGLMYGDGVFRTLRIVDSNPLWWDEHLAKLTEDCARLALTAPDSAVWNADLAKIVPRPSGGILKLLVTRGSGRRGYCPPDVPQIRRLMRYDVTLNSPMKTPVGDVQLRVCSLRLGWQPRLAGIKHLNRLENVLARAEWSDPDIHEGLLLDHSEQVISGVMSNLFIWRQNQLLTPRLDRCGVAGVARARLLRLASAHGFDVKETELNLQSVLEADEVMLTNSVWGLRRVARLETRVWSEPLVSSRLAAMLDA
jgi:4-amino-4-deoxychorismate lyase